MDPERTRDWRDCVPKHIRVTGWPRDEIDWEGEERTWQMMSMVNVFHAKCQTGGLPWILYGFRDLGSFFGLRGEWISGAWRFPHLYNGWTVEIAGQITKAELLRLRPKKRTPG